MPVVVIDVPSLGNRTHLVHDHRVAVAVDPPRDLALVERAAEEAGVDLVAVADTHVHNDYVSGGLALARRHGADYLLSADEAVGFERVGVRAGDVLQYGALELEVLSTPGHTRHHQSYVARVPGEPGALLSGGSLLLGTVGRTDLVDPRLAEHLAGAQWDSARLQLGLAPDTLLLPTHGFGSFCAAATVETDDDATIGGQHDHPATKQPRDVFAQELVAGFGPVPAYYPHMDPINRRGPGTARPARPASAAEVAAAVAAGRWVVDLRDRARHAEAHLAGTVGMEYSDQFATYVGWLVPWGADLLLLTDDPDHLGPAVRDLARIGVEDVGVHVLATGSRLEASYRRTDWATYAADEGPKVVVDVRQHDEYAEGHLPGAVHVPVQDIETAQLPPGELWVHCKSGYRAGIAASLLHRRDRDVVHLDDQWVRVVELGIPTTRAA